MKKRIFDEAEVVWTVNAVRWLAIGGTWGVPRSGLVFTKTAERQITLTNISRPAPAPGALMLSAASLKSKTPNYDYINHAGVTWINTRYRQPADVEGSPMTLSFNIAEYAKRWLSIFPESPRVRLRGATAGQLADGIERGVLISTKLAPVVVVIGEGDRHAHGSKFVWRGSPVEYQETWEDCSPASTHG